VRRRRVASKRYGAPALWRRTAGVGTWRCLPQEIGSSGGVAVQTSRRRGMEPWRSEDAPAANVLPLCLKRSEEALQACRCGGVEVSRSGAPEACCGCRDV